MSDYTKTGKKVKSIYDGRFDLTYNGVYDVFIDNKGDEFIIDDVGDKRYWSISDDDYYELVEDNETKLKFKVGDKVKVVDVKQFSSWTDDVKVGYVGVVIEIDEFDEEKHYKVFFLGGFKDRAEKTAKYFRFRFPELECQSNVGDPEVSNDEVINKINEFKPDILFVAYGMGKQEMWIDEYLKDLKVGIVMGVGRSFDYYSGDLKRAPESWRKLGLEWLYSLIQEPRRFRRQLALPKFVWKVIKN